MTTLVFVEQRNGTPKSTAAELLSVARRIETGAVHAAVFGPGAGQAASGLGALGADTVHVAEGAGLAEYSTQGFGWALSELATSIGANIVLASATPTARDFLPRAAAKLGGGLASDIVALDDDGSGLVATRPLYAGKVLAQARIKASPALFTLRPNAFGAGDAVAGAGEVTGFEPSFDSASVGARVVERQTKQSERPDLQEADRIISGGRAMASAENFSVLAPVADALDAAIGASRAAVDSGYAPHTMQVGQTGKTVNPSLYIACGISGAIQHLAGMRTSKVIVAINKDPEAPIFAHSTYGIVADLFEAVPILADELQKVLD